MKREQSVIETQTFSSAQFTSAPQPGSDESRDLGFGPEVARRSRRRLLNRDGTFNVEREGYSLIKSRSLYHFLVGISWPRFLLLLIGLYLTTNFLFAVAYFACGPGALSGAVGTDIGARFASCFFFSVQTLATIGYGGIAPAGILAHLLVTIEAFIGLMGVALSTGLVFTRFARPTARIVFSRFAIIAPYRGQRAFEFRLANERSNQIFHVDAKVTFSRLEYEGNTLKRRFYQLPLERESVMFLPLSWTVVHPIDGDSPFWGLTAKDLAATDAEILVMLEGTDDTFSQTVHSWTSYKHDEIIWGARFSNVLQETDDGKVKINVERIHDFDLVDLGKADSGTN